MTQRRECRRCERLRKMNGIAGDRCFDGCVDLPHVISSSDVDYPSDYVLWNVLPNHAEFLVAKPALEDYADETEGVERLQLHILHMRSGAEFAEAVRTDIVEMHEDDEEDWPVEQQPVAEGDGSAFWSVPE